MSDETAPEPPAPQPRVLAQITLTETPVPSQPPVLKITTTVGWSTPKSDIAMVSALLAMYADELRTQGLAAYVEMVELEPVAEVEIEVVEEALAALIDPTKPPSWRENYGLGGTP